MHDNLRTHKQFSIFHVQTSYMSSLLSCDIKFYSKQVAWMGLLLGHAWKARARVLKQ